MIYSDKGTVKIDGNILDVYADLAMLIQILGEETVEHGFDAPTVAKNIIAMCCEGLITFLEGQQEELDEDVFSKLFEDAMKAGIDNPDT